MKDFLTTLAIWIVIMFVGLFFFGNFFLSGRHVYGATLVLSLVPATVTHLFYRQSEELEQLRERVKKLEEQLLSPAESEDKSPCSGESMDK